MKNPIVIMNGARIQSDITYGKTSDGIGMCNFIIKLNNEPYYVICFDDERTTSPFKRIKNTLKLGLGSYINLQSELIMYRKLLFTDSAWKKLSNEENRTYYKSLQLKLTSIDYCIPVELHEEIKKSTSVDDSTKIKTLSDLSSFRG